MGIRAALLPLLLLAALPAFAADPVQVRLDTCEPEAVLEILAARQAGELVSDLRWERLFGCEGYRRLKEREASMKRDFTDGDFMTFVLSPELAAREEALRKTLDAWKQADLREAGSRAIAYLPPDAVLRASVYLMIKPRTNSFVFEAATNPAIFLYLDPAVPPAKLENTVAHELHHIGYASLSPRVEAALAPLPERARLAVDWLGAFGEGVAMLAAAGSPDVHPHAASDLEERARWDRDVAKFPADLRTLERFFLDVLEGRLTGKEEISARAFSFFGVQGPWYTVGYRMAALIEERDGREALLACLEDPRRLLAAYNAAALRTDPALPRWSDGLLQKMGATSLPRLTAR